MPNMRAVWSNVRDTTPVASSAPAMTTKGAKLYAALIVEPSVRRLSFSDSLMPLSVFSTIPRLPWHDVTYKRTFWDAPAQDVPVNTIVGPS